jgi:hypothetical protein
MMMVYGAAGVALSILFFGVVLIMCRNPWPSVWTNDFLVGNIYTPAIVAMMAVSVAFFIKFFISLGTEPFSVAQLAMAIGIVAVGIVGLKMLRIKKRLSEYEALQTSADVIQPAAFSKTRNETDEPPHTTTTGRKAA